METPSIYDSEQQIVSTKVIKDLQELADNSQVKAVVLRINSGGGDAYASEQIWRAVKELNKKEAGSGFDGWNGSIGCLLYEYGCPIYHGTTYNIDRQHRYLWSSSRLQ